ncbi:copper resistance CopC/CopD family protein [Paenibacillus koleovorans]|uniref:copper resistance CopC/CopD family protein n=1 Tax=Paenibacillus koleovorans TaxID=121608 RepID=UPI000FD89452|nr:copper resistance protein CopC [Paenibacillus koleovorans]
MMGNFIWNDSRGRRWTSRTFAALMGLVLVWLVSAGLFGMAGQASAHASLLRAEPEPNTALQAAPERITLTFNERLEAELYYIKVFDELGREAVKEKATLSQDQKEMSLTLPKLQNGRYTISYHVVSADGHPVEGAYVLVFGGSIEDVGVAGESSLHAGHGSLTTDMGLTDLLRFIFRIVYYLSLLALAGFVFWGLFLRPETLGKTESLAFYRSWLLTLQRVHLIALLAFIYFHVQNLLGKDEGLNQLVPLFTGTWVGRSWLVSLVLAFAGFLLLYRNRTVDAVWVALLLLAKSWNGHAMGYDPQVVTVLLDWLHLAGSAVWAGGLALIMAGWKSQRAFVDAFLPRFSRGAFVAVVGLILTGIASTLIFLPGLDYLLYSQWGKLLIAKVVFVVLVLLIAGGIRMAMKQRNAKDLRDYLRLDFVAMIIIVSIVGLFTYISPVPPNEPLYWHEMGEAVHMTTKISPKVPGDNQIEVTTWMTEKAGKPKEIVLNLHNMDKKDMAAISVPLKEISVEKVEGTFGENDDVYLMYTYKASGPFIPFAGLWKIEFRVLDSNDDETVYERVERVY